MHFPRVGRIPTRHVLHRNPVIGREGVDSPSSIESANAGVLLSSERAEGQVVDRLIVDVSHAGFDTLGKPRIHKVATRAADVPPLQMLAGVKVTTGARSLGAAECDFAAHLVRNRYEDSGRGRRKSGRDRRHGQ